MDFEHENGNGEERRHADLAASSEAERIAGEDQPAPLHIDDMDLSRAMLLEKPVSALRRRAERRRSSALIALWVDVERRSGEDQRASPGGNDIDHD